MSHYACFIKRLGMILGVSMLSACAYYQHLHDERLTQKDCRSACQERWRQCDRLCDHNAMLCNAKADAIAAVHFNHYKRQQCIRGEGITLGLHSFRDPLACTKMTCDCTEDYAICRQACQGKIEKRLQPLTL